MKISYGMILIIIILVILIIIIISSIPYSGQIDKNEVVKNTKEFNNNPLYEMKNIRPEIKHNCSILHINNMDGNKGYSIIGNFNESCFSIYKNNERLYSKIINGSNNIIIGSNQNILTPLIKLSKYKNILIPLENFNDYIIVFDKSENVEIKNYKVNSSISFKNISYSLDKMNINEGFNEYDIHYLTNKSFNLDSNNILDKNISSDFPDKSMNEESDIKKLDKNISSDFPDKSMKEESDVKKLDKNISSDFPDKSMKEESDVKKLDKNISSDFPDKSMKEESDVKKLDKIYISHFNKYDEWELNKEGEYIISIVNNLYNFDIKDKRNNEVIKIRKSDNPPEIIFKRIHNPNIVIKNLDFINDKKDINTEYIELINGPVHLVERFLKGKKSRKINYSMLINNKINVFKV